MSFYGNVYGDSLSTNEGSYGGTAMSSSAIDMIPTAAQNKAAFRSYLHSIHGILMVIVWLLAVPLGVGLNMYGRKKSKTWAVKAHKVIMLTVAFLPLTSSGIIAFILSGSKKHASHNAIGATVVIGTWAQILLGAVNSLIYKSRIKRNRVPVSRPWHNHLHIWWGRILMILAFVNIAYGLRIRHASNGYFIAYGVWVGVIVIALIFVARLKQEIAAPNDQSKETVVNAVIAKE